MTSGEPSSRRLLRSGTETPWQWLGFAFVLAVAFVYLTLRGRGTGFYYDDWLWVVQRNSGLHAILAAYNQHLVAGAVAVYQLLFRTVGLGDHWVYRLIETVSHLGCAIAVFAYARRRVGWLALPLVVPLLFLGSGWEFVLWSVNFGSVVSLALGIAALLALDSALPRRSLLACGLLLVGVCFSENAAIFALGLAVECTLHDRGLRRAWIWGLPLALFGLWWLGYHEPAHLRANLTIAPSFAAELAAGAAGGLLGLSIDWGRVLIAGAIGLAAWRWLRLGAAGSRGVGLAVTAAVFWLLVALGRAQLGEPTAPRYVYVGAVLLLLILAESLRGLRPTGRQLALAGLLAAFALAGNLRALTAGVGVLRTAQTRMAAELGALELARKVVWPALLIDPVNAPGLAAGPYLSAVDRFGSSPADKPDQILRAPESARIAADQLLLHGQDLRVSVAPAAGHAGGTCIRLAGPATALRLGPAGVILRPSGAEAEVRARRFAAAFDASPMASVRRGQAIALRPAVDRSELPWELQVSSALPVLACSSG